MKKLLLFLSVTFCILHFQLAQAQIPSYVPTNGLVAYYPFNGNANDASGNGNNGTLNGGVTFQNDRFGNQSKSCNFNGDGFIEIPSLLNIQYNPTTYSAWIRASSLVTDIRPLGAGVSIVGRDLCGQGIQGQLVVWHNPNVSINQQLDFYTGGSGVAFNYSVPLNQWIHVVFSWDQNDTMKLYVNGQLIQSTYSSSSGFLSNGMPPFRIGSGAGNCTNNSIGRSFWKGDIDEVTIYNRALSQSEITGLYNAGTNTCLPSYLPTTGLVGYWPFCGNANDESGNGNNGTVNGATLTTDRFGNASSSYAFDRISIKSIDVAQSATLNNMQNMSISLWCNLASYASPSNPGYNHFINKSSGLTTHQFVFANNINGLYCYYNNDPSFFSTNTLPSLNTWHNLTLTYSYNPLDTSTSLCKFYVDGILKNQFRTNAYLPITNFNLKIGSQTNLLVNNVDGKLDDIAIYNRALSATEVQNLYNASAPTTCIANITNNDTTICAGQSLTLNATAVASGSVTDINGNVYPTVNIGSQTWMQKNLNVSKYRNGDIIPQVTNVNQWAALTTGAWCWYNNDSATYAATYGKIYNGYAVKDSRGLAPDGWHVSTNSDWNILEKAVDPNVDTMWQATCGYQCGQISSTLGGLLKETGTTHWLSPNTGATDNYNFKALPGGYRNAIGSFLSIGELGQFYTSTNGPNGNTEAIFRTLLNNSSAIGSDYGYVNKNGFSVRCVKDIFNSNTSTYLWSNGTTTPSITVSPTATTTYYLTVTDANGNTCRDSVKVTVNTAIPATPGTITGATDVCSSFSSITAASSNAVTYSVAAMSTATSYTWAVPAGVTIVSGQGTNSISVTFANTFVSGAITVKANNACGSSTAARSLSVYRRVAATPGTVQKSFVPSVVAVTSVCGLASEVYMIRKVTYATSYNWSLALGTNATITHLNALGANDTAIRVTFAAGFVRDTIRVTAQTACSVSALRTVVLNATVTPPAVTAITTVAGNFTVCIGSTLSLTALSTVPTATQSAIQYFRWTKPANTTITAASADSATISLRIDAGFTGGSVSVKTASACGFYGAAKTATLQYLPPTPSAISSATGSYNACIGNSISYSVLVAQALSSQSVATVFRWTKPANTSITSATADSSTITLQFNTGFIGGSLTVRGQSSCGTQGAAYSQVLTHGGCPAGTRTTPNATNDGANTKFEAQLFPNPTTSAFNLKVSGASQLPVVVKLRDAEGRLMKSFTTKAGELANFGNDLVPGVYMIEVMQGEERKVLRGVRM